MEIRFKIDDGAVVRLMETTNVEKASELGRDAFAFLSWAANEISNGRQVQSVDMSGNHVNVPVMPIFDQVRNTRNE